MTNTHGSPITKKKHGKSIPRSRSRSRSRSMSRSRSRSRSRARSPEKKGPYIHYLQEGDDEYEEKQRILSEGSVGDKVVYLPNNQQGMWSAIIKSNNGEKYLRYIETYDNFGGSKKRGKTQRRKIMNKQSSSKRKD